MRYREADRWTPTDAYLERSNLTGLIAGLGLPDYDAFLRLSVEEPNKYWDATLKHLNIRFDPPADAFVDLSAGKPWARFFPGGGFNFAEACLVFPQGSENGSEIALIWESENGHSETLSYAELARRTRKFAAGLRDIGVSPGDGVGILFPNTPEAVISFLAICYIGAIVVPLYSGYGSDAIARRLIDSQAKFLIAADGFHRREKYVSLKTVAVNALAEVDARITLILICEADQNRPDVPHVRWQDVEARGDDGARPAATLTDTPFMVIYTSGTTGKPKGAVHAHAGFPLRVAQDVGYLFDFKQGDRYLWPSDMGWMVGPYSICSVLLLKGALVLYDGAPDYPDVSRLRAVAGRHGVTHFGSTPTAIRMMAANEQVCLSAAAPALRVLMSGGEVMDEDSFSWFFQHFGGGKLPIINYTGGTESSGALLTNVVLRPILPCRFNSRAPGVDVHVIDPQGNALHQEVGELAIFAPFVGMTSGFWQDAARYVETYWERVPGKWVHGDLAIEESDGQLLLLGRSDDVMKISGKRVGPSEIEGIVADGDLISDVLVFSVPDARSGEAMIVFAVPGPRGRMLEDAAIESEVGKVLKIKMGASFKAHAVVVVDALIKTKNGKLVRRLARQAWLAQAPGDLSAIDDPAVFFRIVTSCEAYRAARK